jgi:hypothetical protein
MPALITGFFLLLFGGEAHVAKSQCNAEKIIGGDGEE